MEQKLAGAIALNLTTESKSVLEARACCVMCMCLLLFIRRPSFLLGPHDREHVHRLHGQHSQGAYGEEGGREGGV